MVVDDGNHISIEALDGCFETTDVPSLPLLRSGFDIRRLYFKYDVDSDIMHVGVDCYGVCGDTDGDRDADSASTAWKLVNGRDSASLASPEFFHLALDTSPSHRNTSSHNFSVAVVFGTHPSSSTGYSSFGTYFPSTKLTLTEGPLVDVVGQLQSAQFYQPSPENLTAPIVNGLVDPAIRIAEGKNTSYGDLEFSISHFSSIPGLNWTSSSQAPLSLSFKVIAFFGSLSSTPYPTIDAVPGQFNRALGDSGSASVALDCTQGLDPFGVCCSFDLRDLCGVCHGNLSNLDPCGSCRYNASLVPPSTCPAAASSQHAVIPDIGASIAPNLVPNASMAIVDINGDHIQDIVIGVPELNLIYIKFLNRNGSVSSNTTIHNPASVPSATDQFGFSVAHVGDVNGDGVPDLVVGSPGVYPKGAAWVLLLTAYGTPSVIRKIAAPDSLVPSFSTPEVPTTCVPPIPIAVPIDTPIDTPNTSQPNAPNAPGVPIVPTLLPPFGLRREPSYHEPHGFPFVPHTVTAPSNTSSRSNSTSPTVNNSSVPLSSPSSTLNSSLPTPDSAPTLAPASNIARLENNEPNGSVPEPIPFTEPNPSPPIATPYECSQSPPVYDPMNGVRFGTTLLWLGRNYLLVSAPGALNSASTSYTQSGAFLLSALATDGNSIGSYALETPITAELAAAAGLNADLVVATQIGQDAQNAASTSSQFTLAATVSWKLQSGATHTSLILLDVRPDGTVPEIVPVSIPSTPIALPEFPNAPLFNSSIVPPNTLPFQNNYTFSLIGAGDIDGDGLPDVVLSIPTNDPDHPVMIMTCVIGDNGVITQTQLIGENGVGHSPLSLPPGYELSVLSALIWTNSIVVGMTPKSGSPTLVIAAVNPDAPVMIYALALWGNPTTSNPGVPTSTSPSATPGSPSTVAPLGSSPVSIIAPSPAYPLSPHASTDPIALSFLNNGPNMRISSAINYYVWTSLQFSKIVERTSTPVNSPIILKTLYFPSRWTNERSSDGTLTTFSGRLVDASGWPSTVEVQIQVVTPVTDSTIVFAPSAYVGAHKNTVKYSLLIRGWVFSQPKTILDIVTNVQFNEPIISVSTQYPTTNSPDRSTRFNLQTPSSRTVMTVPTFALIDGILSNVPTPTFNQTTGQFTLTVPPFFDTLYYDPDVGVVATVTPKSHIDDPKGPRGKSLLYIIIPSAIGIIIVGVLIVILATCLCQQRRAEQRWKDAGAV